MHDIFSYVYLPLLLRPFSIVCMHLDGNTVNFVLGIVLEFSCTNLLLFLSDDVIVIAYCHRLCEVEARCKDVRM